MSINVSSRAKCFYITTEQSNIRFMYPTSVTNVILYYFCEQDTDVKMVDAESEKKTVIDPSSLLSIVLSACLS